MQLPSAAVVVPVLLLELSVLGEVAGVVETDPAGPDEVESEATIVALPSDPVHVVPAATAPIGIHCPQLHMANPCPALVHLSVPIALEPHAPWFSVEIGPVGVASAEVGAGWPEEVLVGTTEKVIVVDGAVAVAMTKVVVDALDDVVGVSVELPDTV